MGTDAIEMWAPMMGSLPYGTDDLDPVAVGKWDGRAPSRLKCYVRGCAEILRRVTKERAGEACPAHGIFVHFSRNGPTYRYVDARRNLIVDSDLAAQRVVGHPFKYDSRFEYENSEDALTWNVFRSLQRAGQLHEVARLITGRAPDEEPRLYLWGLSLSDDSFVPWPMLIRARDRFEGRLPVARPLTEPDIALHLPGKYLILIEAKFTSSNPAYKDGPRKDQKSLTKTELIDIYQDRQLDLLDIERARSVPFVHYQLWRNFIFAGWMAHEGGEPAYLGSLTRNGQEDESCAAFASLIRPAMAGRFRHFFWEDTIQCGAKDPGLATMRRYLQTKTAYLAKALALPVS
jgi:hypothetical protein